MPFTNQDFIHSITTLPEQPKLVELEQAIGPALQHEEHLRRHLVAISDPYGGLIDIFDTSSQFRLSRPRTFADNADLESKTLFPLRGRDRPVAGTPSCVANADDFKNNFRSFSHNILGHLSSWSNVIVAGGSILASLVETTAYSSNRLQKVYHAQPYAAADIDIFLWGLTETEAKEKIVMIFKAIQASVPWDVVAVRRANVLSIHTQFPSRQVQIILRLYQSPTEVLIGFDVDCSGVCFDGSRVWATPRAMAAIVTRSLRIDMTRRSPSYELRLIKYVRRGWEIFYPDLRRGDLSDAIYARDLQILPSGLARLLVYERLLQDATYYYHIWHPIKPVQNLPDQEVEVLEDTDWEHDYTLFHIPYALKWDAKKVMRMANDAERLDARYNNESYLHRHSMVAHRDIRNCFKDICDTCPLARTNEEIIEQASSDKTYIRGPLRFITENPGNQIISGSFHPITNGQWDLQAYQGF